MAEGLYLLDDAGDVQPMGQWGPLPGCRQCQQQEQTCGTDEILPMGRFPQVFRNQLLLVRPVGIEKIGFGHPLVSLGIALRRQRLQRPNIPLSSRAFQESECGSHLHFLLGNIANIHAKMFCHETMPKQPNTLFNVLSRFRLDG